MAKNMESIYEYALLTLRILISGFLTACTHSVLGGRRQGHGYMLMFESVLEQYGWQAGSDGHIR